MYPFTANTREKNHNSEVFYKLCCLTQMKKARGVKGDSIQYTMLCNQLSKGIESLLLTEELDGANL